MTKAKLILFVVVVGVIVIATIPWWGSCDLNARFCSTWCDIRNAGNDMKAAGCRTRCAMKQARCHGEEASENLNDFLKGLQGK